MSSITAIMRHLMAIMQPVSGTRASGSALVKSAAGGAMLPLSSYAVPIVEGAYRSDLVVKVAPGPNADGSWSVTPAGVQVNFISNLGGARHNLLGATKLVFDPALSGISSAVVSADWAGGEDPLWFGGVRDIAPVERFEGPNQSLDLGRSTLLGFPAVIVAWADSEPADGATTSMTIRETRTGTRRALYRESFRIYVITSRGDKEHVRREEGLEILDSITQLLADRQAVDGVPFSSPSGVQVRQRWRESGPQRIYQKYFIYALMVGVEVTLQATDSRTWADLEKIVFDVLRPQEPALPNQGPITVVDDVEVDMTP